MMLVTAFLKTQSNLASLSPLLAQRLSDLGRRFRHGGSNLDATQVIVFVVAIGALIGGAYILSRYVNDNRPCNHPGKLHRELCRAHKLSWSDRRLLNQVAACHQIEMTASLFIAPDLFDPSGLPPQLQKRRDQIQQLRARIFGP